MHHLRIALSDTPYYSAILVKAVVRINFFNSSLEGRAVVRNAFRAHSKQRSAPFEISMPQSMQKYLFLRKSAICDLFLKG